MCLYTKQCNGAFLYVLLYVDHLLICGNADEFRATFHLADFMALEKELARKGIKLANIPATIPTTKRKLVIYEDEHRLITFFSLTVSSPPKRPAIFNNQNRLGHATYSAKEFDIVLRETQNNEDFVRKNELVPSEV